MVRLEYGINRDRIDARSEGRVNWNGSRVRFKDRINGGRARFKSRVNGDGGGASSCVRTNSRKLWLLVFVVSLLCIASFLFVNLKCHQVTRVKST